jgi:predicted RNase H-like nuclease (RuvC/YqgF family)
MSAAELKKKIFDLNSVLAEYKNSLREAKTDHDKSQYRKFISDTENKISGLEKELRSSY